MPKRESALTKQGADQAKTKNTSNYTAGEIKILGDMEAVRARPIMYIGSTGEQGLYCLFDELVHNSFNEALAGFASRIDVTIHTDSSVTVVDDGRGIPVDDFAIYGSEKVPFAQLILTRLRAGGKFSIGSHESAPGACVASGRNRQVTDQSNLNSPNCGSK